MKIIIYSNTTVTLTSATDPMRVMYTIHHQDTSYHQSVRSLLGTCIAFSTVTIVHGFFKYILIEQSQLLSPIQAGSVTSPPFTRKIVFPFLYAPFPISTHFLISHFPFPISTFLVLPRQVHTHTFGKTILVNQARAHSRLV